jgi:hypothetical protein
LFPVVVVVLPLLTPPQESKDIVSRSSIAINFKTLALLLGERMLPALQTATIPGNSNHSA